MTLLLVTIGVGFTAAVLRAQRGRRRLSPPHLHGASLVPAVFIPQGLAFYLPRLWPQSHSLTAMGLVMSQLGLLAFVWRNRGQTGMRLLGLGLVLNLLVITLNGGWMPISPETLSELVLDADPQEWLNRRLGTSKDIVLPETETRLPWLSDRFILDVQGPCRVAFSIGDVGVALGALQFTWAMGRKVNGDPVRVADLATQIADS